MSEALKSIYESFNNRLKNPFIGALFFSFIIFKWEQLIILFSSHLNGEEKIVCIKELNHEQSNWIYLVILIVAIGYMYIPKLLMLAFEKWGRNWIEEKRYEISWKRIASKNGLKHANDLVVLQGVIQHVKQQQNELANTLSEEERKLVQFFNTMLEINKEDKSIPKILTLKDRGLLRADGLDENNSQDSYMVYVTPLGKLINLDLKQFSLEITKKSTSHYD